MLSIKRTVRKQARYTAQDAPSTRLKITGDGRTDRQTDGRTDTPSYRDATAHLKSEFSQHLKSQLSQQLKSELSQLHSEVLFTSNDEKRQEAEKQLHFPLV